ncbi:fimbria/pilus outer membrane usher protein [Siccibacter turicensis]|uniref:fimbria/pilus outer membrane usher protein n=1 Tax=Siccibacter turicensis TaxID=357233 RepID=UPI000465B4C2|nr:fimbria/pilus outer membrane usher protein [Siccibacter turicensis]
MANRASALTTLSVATFIATTPSAAHAANGDDALPPPPDVRAINARATYHLGLVVNHYDTGQLVQATRREGDFYVKADDLKQAGIPADHLPAGAEVNVTRLPEVQTDYDSTRQRLLLTVPNHWLPGRDITLGQDPDAVAPRNSTGALLNYDFYTNDTQKSGSQASLWHELRFFSDIGTLSSTGIARQTFQGYTSQHNGYRRYDTTFTGNDEKDTVSWSVGDVISDSLTWSSSVRMGGISWGRDFSLRPDLITYPLPAFSGEAAVPSTVDVFINGYRSGSTTLQPGPFTLTNLPYVNGSGDAVLVTTDAQGRQVSTTLPFYVASDLLKQGLSDGAFTLGALRRNYGLKDFDYGPAAGSGSLRYGVTDWWTAEAHTEGAESLALGGVGSMFRIGQFGVINGAFTQSRMRGDRGQQINWGYQYNGAWFNIGTQHTERDRTFGNLALYDLQPVYDINRQPTSTLSRTSDQYTFSLNLGRYGNLGAAYIDVRSFDDEKTRLLNLSWSKNFWDSSFYVAASHDPDKEGWTVAMSLQIPFGTLDSVALSVDNARDTGTSTRVTYNHAMPSDGGFNWDMAYANRSRDDDYQQASLGWRNNAVELRGGIYGESGGYTRWGQASGSLVVMDNAVFAANQINDAFAVISTNGQPNVTVNFENQPAGQTDDDGYLLVSGVTAYYPATYSINTLDLPADTRIKDTERRIAIKRGSGYVIAFPMDRERVASVILHDEHGEPLPVSSQVSRPMLPSAIVGYEGIAWLENISDVNHLQVTTPDGERCAVTFNAISDTSHMLKTYGPVICKKESR